MSCVVVVVVAVIVDVVDVAVDEELVVVHRDAMFQFVEAVNGCFDDVVVNCGTDFVSRDEADTVSDDAAFFAFNVFKLVNNNSGNRKLVLLRDLPPRPIR